MESDVVVYRRMSVQRVIDSSSNRLAEALRVMEDVARYTLDREDLVTALKSMRHEIRTLSGRWPEGWSTAHRDVPGDVGTEVSTPDETRRSGVWDVAVAAGHRAAEALRTLEEITKIFDQTAAARCETLRYRLYGLDQQLQAALGSRRRRQWNLCVLLTESACTLPWLETAEAVIEAGADCIQLREKSLSDRELVDRTRRLVELARPRACSIVVNDRLDVALAADADGVHLGQDDLSIEDARRQAGHSLLIGVSTHGRDEAEAAVDGGADVCGVGPMFAGRTRPDLEPAGPRRLAEFIKRFPTVPHLAIGGITPEHLPALRDAGCKGIAVSQAVCGSSQPGEVVRTLLTGLAAPAAEQV